MAKVGHAFSDSILTGGITGKKRRGHKIGTDIISLVPLLILILVAAFLLIRLFYIQLIQGSYYKALSDNNRTRTKVIPASRGIIFDRDKKPLVRNVPAFKMLEKGKIVFLDKDDALARIAKGQEVQNDIQRDYLFKDAFAHIIGYIGQISKNELMLPIFSGYFVTDFNGKMGLEQEYEILLHGQNGKELYEVDAQGRQIKFLGRQEAIPGQDLMTTLDSSLQIAAAVNFPKDKKGAVVISDPRGGSIRALYSSPSFDPNLFTHLKDYTGSGNYKSLSSILMDGANQPFLDRAISGTYPPGSTFKLIVATAALESGAITPDTQIEDTGILKVGDFSFGNWYFLQYGRREGMLNIVGAIKRSNDIFFYQAADKTGVDTLSSWAKKFGLGAKLEIDLPNESAGLVPTKEWKQKVVGEQWYLGDTYHYGIGQGFLLTNPLQVNSWTSVFANGGILYKPHIIECQMSNIQCQISKKNFIKPQTIDLVREGMRQACNTGGVAWPLFNFKVKNDSLLKKLESNKESDTQDYSIDASGSAKMVRVQLGCKTGTAETTTTQDPHAWITVIAPFYHPEIVVTVLVENGGEGSSVAGPIAEKILKAYFEKK